jgi:hypothetical protein
MEGPRREGVVMGHGHVDFDGYVVSVTRPGGSRMPNGIEAAIDLIIGERATVGGGRLELGRQAVEIGPDWDPRPKIGAVAVARPGPAPDPALLAGRGPGLTPDGDDFITGYAAGLVLLHGKADEAMSLAEAAAARTTSLAATLLRHAARGELPEPAHAYLVHGSEAELLAWGNSSGRMLLNGLQLAGAKPPP